MASFMGAYGGQTYALMRIVLGFHLPFHGTQKLLGFPLPPPKHPRLSSMSRVLSNWSVEHWS